MRVRNPPGSPEAAVPGAPAESSTGWRRGSRERARGKAGRPTAKGPCVRGVAMGGHITNDVLVDVDDYPECTPLRACRCNLRAAMLLGLTIVAVAR